MRMVKRAAVLLGLIAVLAVGIVLVRMGGTLRQEEAVLEWSNALVSREIGTPSTPRFLSQAIQVKPSPNVWVVSGELALPSGDNTETRNWYVAVIRQVCETRKNRDCWALQSFTFGEPTQRTSVADASPGGAIMEIEIPEETTQTIETVPDRATNRDGLQTSGRAAASAPVEEPLPVTQEPPPTDFALQAGNESDQAMADETPDVKSPVLETAAGPEEPPSSTEAASQPETAAAEPQAPAAASVASSATTEPKGSEAQSVANSPAATDGDSGSGLVFLIQDRLNRLGFGEPSLPLDGRLGPETREAILAYQSTNGLVVDGKPSPALLRHLEAKIRRPAAAN